jgi:hypothetical protein
VSGFAIEHDEAINDWFIQGVVDGSPVGSTAVVSGPEPTIIPSYPPARPAAGAWVRTVTFSGVTPAEVFGKATTWLAARPDAVQVGDVDWQAQQTGDEPYQLRLHYRA